MEKLGYSADDSHGSTMNYRPEHWTDARIEAQMRLAIDSLKCCPLCGAVNAAQNHECFVCRWQGRFDRDPERIENGLNDLLDRCPELIEIMLETPPPARTPWERFKLFVGRIFGRNKQSMSLDLWV